MSFDIIGDSETTRSNDFLGFGTGLSLFTMGESCPPDDRNSGPEVLPVKCRICVPHTLASDPLINLLSLKDEVLETPT